MNLFAIASLTDLGTTSLLALLIIRYGDLRNILQRILLMENVALAIWGFGCMMAGLSKNIAYATLGWKIAHIGAFATSLFIFHLALVLTNTKRTALLLFGYLLAIVIPILAFTDRLQLKLALVDSYYYIQADGITYPIFGALFLLLGIYTTVILYNAFRHATGAKRTQIKYLFVAIALGYWGGCTHFFMLLGIKIIPIGNFLIALFPLITTYAILRHQLLDIEVIIKKTLVFAGLLIAVFTMLVLPTLLIQEYIFRGAGFAGKMLGLAISGTIIILTMRRIETFLINVTDKYLFQKKYDYKELLKTFTSEVLTVLELDKLVNLTVNNLSDTIKLSSAAVLLFNDEEQQFEVMAQRNIKDPNVKLIRPDGIVTFLDETHGYLLVRELRGKKIFIPDSVQEVIDKLNAELIVPMVMHDEVMGVLSLGKKKSDEEYSQDDLDILLPLAKTLAIAISNAQLFDELSKTQAEAAQKDKMAVIGTLSAGINHEICNPLGIARGQCEAFLLNIKDGLYKAKTTEELLAKAKDIMGKVIHETDRATAITKKLSQFAKPAKGDAEMVNVPKEIEDVLGLVGYELKLEKIEIEKRFDKNLPHIFVDKKLFQEVLFNLLRNAGQAIGEKGKVTIAAWEERGKILIDIQDSGDGIPEDKIKQLFNPFFTTKDPGKGTGLGLFIVRQIVEKNGGRIYLKKTNVGEGTTFRLEFPTATAAKQEGKDK